MDEIEHLFSTSIDELKLFLLHQFLDQSYCIVILLLKPALKVGLLYVDEATIRILGQGRDDRVDDELDSAHRGLIGVVGPIEVLCVSLEPTNIIMGMTNYMNVEHRGRLPS